MRLSYIAVVCFGFLLAGYSQPRKHTDHRNQNKQPAINTSSTEEKSNASRQAVQDLGHYDAQSGPRTGGDSDTANSGLPPVTAAAAPSSPNSSDINYEDALIPVTTVQVVSLPARDWLDKSAILINGILAIVGIGGILVAVFTLRKIERQTKATEAQASHMVESARPFLMIEVLGDENHASFKVCNRGISPAKILFMDRILRPTYLSIGESLPLVHDYGQYYRNIVDVSINAEPVNAEWISPGGQTFIGTVYPKSEIAMLRSSSPHTQIGPRAVWHFGVVVYKGLFSPKYYESRYCYRLLENQWRMLGPYGYNEYK